LECVSSKASGSVGLVRDLVHEYGPSISKASDYGTTPIHLAAVIEHSDMLLALLEHPGNAQIAMTVRYLYKLSSKA
jgi:ankyrin repeat protein